MHINLCEHLPVIPCTQQNYIKLLITTSLRIFFEKNTQPMASSIQCYVQGKGRHADDLYHMQAALE